MTIPEQDLDLDKQLTELAHVYYVQLFEEETVAQSIDRIRDATSGDRIAYFYATTRNDQIRGVVPARRLLVSKPETRIADIMIGPVVTIPETSTLREALTLLADRRLMAVPIVDDHGHLNGVIDLEHYTRDAIDLEQREAAETVFQLVGVHIENEKASVWNLFRDRFPWLLCNVASGLAAAMISGAFDDLLKAAVALAFFFPLVLGISESVSIVAVTLGLQQMHHPGRGYLREYRIAPVLGLAAGLVVATTALVWLKSYRIAEVLVVSLGLFLPRLVHRWNLDPKIAAGPAVLAITDILTISAYLTIATLVLR
jgi:magnesium transporter